MKELIDKIIKLITNDNDIAVTEYSFDGKKHVIELAFLNHDDYDAYCIIQDIENVLDKLVTIDTEWTGTYLEPSYKIIIHGDETVIKNIVDYILSEHAKKL